MLSENTSARIIKPEIGDANNSGINWGAVFAGAVVSASMLMLMLVLGVGFGLSSISPWENSGVSAKAIGASSIIWLAFTQLVAFGIGGYLTGRLRIKWANVHTDEVYFRDTAHGLLAWSVAALVTVILLASSTKAILNGVAESNATGVAPMGNMKAPLSISENNPVDYFVDLLLRKNQSDPNTDNVRGGNNLRAEVETILTNNIKDGKLSIDDRTYLSQIVSQQTGLPQADAELRVESIFAKISASIETTKNYGIKALDTARKVSAHTTLWMFVMLLLGAFISSLTATYGGRLRDYHNVYVSN